MSSAGAGYDLDSTTFSPDGRLFQIEYAGKAVEWSGTLIAAKTKNSVVFSVEKPRGGKMTLIESNSRIFKISKNAIMVYGGLAADARQVAQIARDEASEYKNIYREEIPLNLLADRVASYIFTSTFYSPKHECMCRPFGVSIMLGGVYNGKPHLYHIEPSGNSTPIHTFALGRHAQQAKTQLETKILPNLQNMTTQEALESISEIVVTLHDDAKEKEMLLECAVVEDQAVVLSLEQSTAVHQQILNAGQEANL